MMRMIDGDGNLILLITAEIIENLKEGKGLMINLPQMGNPPFTDIMLAYEETVAIAMEKMKGMITPDTVIINTDNPNEKPN